MVRRIRVAPLLISFVIVVPPLLADALAIGEDRAENAEPTGDQEASERKAPSSRPTIELYGYLKLDGSWDSTVIDAGNFARWVASCSAIEPHDHFNLTVRQSRVGLRVGRARDGGFAANGRLEIDFYGGGAENKNQPMLRHGYAEIEWPDRGLTVLAGQTSDLISPLAPVTINYPVAWWAGNIGYRRPQIRITRATRNTGHDVIVAAVALSRSIGDDFGKVEPGDSGADSGVPTVQLALSRQFSRFGRRGSVGLSGHWGKEELHEELQEPLLEFDSWSINFDLSLPLSNRLTLQAEIWTGEDLDDYLGGVGQGINRTTGEAIGSSGGWLSIEGRLRPRAFFGAGVSLDDPDDDDLPPEARSRNGSLWLTFLFDLRSYLRAGVEVSHWETDYIDLEDNSALRVQGTLIYAF